MSHPIDYSKWDHVADSDDDEDFDEQDNEEERENEEERDSHRKPVVTRLDHPSQVTIGPNGLHVDHPHKATATPFRPAQQAVTVHDEAHVSSTPFTTTAASVGVPPMVAREDLKRDDNTTDDLEDDMMITKLTRNGQIINDRYFWSQTRDSATLCVILPFSTKGKDITKFRIQPVALGSQEDITQCGSADLSFCVDGKPFDLLLRYPVKCSEDDVEGCWQLHTLSSKHMRIMVVQLRKDDFAKGVYLWWDKACVGEPPIDTRLFEDRKTEAKNDNMQQVWNAAHEEFRLRMQAMKGNQKK